MPPEVTVAEAMLGARAMYENENGPDTFLALPMRSQLHQAFVFCVGIQAAGLRSFAVPAEMGGE